MRMAVVVPTSLVCAMLLGVPAPTLGADARGDAHHAAEVDSILGQDRIELIDLFRLAELSSPEVAAARADVSASAGRLRQVGTYANPSIGVGIDEASVEDFSDRKQIIEIEQPLLFGSRRGPAKAALSASLQAAERTADDIRREVRGRAHALLIEVRYARARSEALDGLVAEADETYGIARKRFEARAVPESHATRALLDRYELEMDREDSEAERLEAIAQLGALLGGIELPADRLGASPRFDAEVDTTALIEQVLATHPGVAAADQEAAAAEARVRWARARGLPDLELRAGYGRQVALDEDFVEAGIAIDLPLFDRNQGAIEEAQADVHRAEQHAIARRQQLTTRIAGAIRHRSITSRQLAAHQESIEPAAARGLQQARAAYRAGSLSFLELLDAQQTFAHVRIRTLELERDLDLTSAELARLAGLGPYQE
jgi:cobalt-zinc-cadmium efflux system outer membrane protein